MGSPSARDSLSRTGWVRSISIGGLAGLGRSTGNSEIDAATDTDWLGNSGYRSKLNCLEWLDISTMFIKPK